MEFIGAMIGLSILWWTVAIVVASLLFPLFWIWMLLDSILRNDYEYPTGGQNEKIVWVILLAAVQFVAVFYYFMVYRAVQRGSVAPSAGAQVSPQSPSAAAPC